MIAATDIELARRAGIAVRWLQLAPVGASDLVGLRSDGQFLSIEVKSARGSLSREQSNWGRMIQRFGGLHVVARSVEEAMEGLK